MDFHSFRTKVSINYSFMYSEHCTLSLAASLVLRPDAPDAREAALVSCEERDAMTDEAWDAIDDCAEATEDAREAVSVVLWPLTVPVEPVA